MRVTLGLERGFGLLARGSGPQFEHRGDGHNSSRSRFFFDLDFVPPVS